MAVSFDLFGTLVVVDRPADPAGAVGRALAERGVAVPDDWSRAYRESHRPVEPGRELALDEHVRAALASRGIDVSPERVERAVLAAFTAGPVRTCEGVAAALATASGRGPVGVCSNCSVPGLVEWALAESALEVGDLTAVVTSVGCGWRKPDRRAFDAAADALGVAVSDLVHVGDDPETDGGVTDAGGAFVHVDGTALPEVADALEGRSCG